MKVIDSSTVAKFVNREPDWEEAGEALRGGCVSIELAVKETGNSIWKRVRRGELESRQANRLFREFVTSVPFKIAEQAELYVPALEVAIRSSLSVYGSLFVALAKARGLPLVTSDASQAEAAKRLGVEVQLIG